MARAFLALLLGAAFWLPSLFGASANELAGKWKITLLGQGARTLWLIEIDSKDNKWSGKVLDQAAEIPAATIEDISVTEDRIRFTLSVRGQSFSFEGKSTGGAKKILGSMDFGRQMVPAEIESTNMKDFKDNYQASKELLARQPDSPEAFGAVFELLNQATAKKSKLEEVRGWAARAAKTSESYGPRWQRHVVSQIAEILVSQQGMAPVAVEYARRAERLLEPTDDATSQIQVLDTLAMALRKTNRIDDAKEIEIRVEKLEAKADQDYLKKVPPLKPEPFEGRKKANDRVVLVELFTGSQCPPCVAADLAFDALEKTFKPNEAAFLEYHLHVPAPDPLTNSDSEARMQFYSVKGTPTILFDGKAKAPGGGSLTGAMNKYREYREVIDPLLEVPPKARLKAAATRTGDQLDISAEVSELEATGEKIRLRFALVENEVRYAGGNRIRLHHRVVRALPGGASGFPLKEKSDKKSIPLSLVALRQDLNKYLDEAAKKEPFSDAKRPLNLDHLSVIAFVQNDETKEVLQATEVKIKSAAVDQ